MKNLCPQLRCDLFQAGQVELADLALVAVAQAVILGGVDAPRMPVRNTSSKSRMRSPARCIDLRKSLTLAAEKAASMAACTAS